MSAVPERKVAGRIRRTEACFHALLVDRGFEQTTTRRPYEFVHLTRPLVVTLEHRDEKSSRRPVVAVIESTAMRYEAETLDRLDQILAIYER